MSTPSASSASSQARNARPSDRTPGLHHPRRQPVLHDGPDRHPRPVERWPRLDEHALDAGLGKDAGLCPLIPFGGRIGLQQPTRGLLADRVGVGQHAQDRDGRTLAPPLAADVARLACHGDRQRGPLLRPARLADGYQGTSMGQPRGCRPGPMHRPRPVRPYLPGRARARGRASVRTSGSMSRVGRAGSGQRLALPRGCEQPAAGRWSRGRHRPQVRSPSPSSGAPVFTARPAWFQAVMPPAMLVASA